MENIIFLENTIIKYDDESRLLFERVIAKKNEVLKDTSCSFGITVDGSGNTNRNFIEDPYFKIYDGNNVKNSKHVTRIKVFEPSYVIHNNQVWNISSKYKRALNEILSAHDYKNWKILLNECVIESGQDLSKEEYDKFMSTPMPDYTKLKNIK